MRESPNRVSCKASRSASTCPSRVHWTFVDLLEHNEDQYEEDFLKFTGYVTGDAKRREALEAALGGDDDAGGKKGKKAKKGKKKK